MSIQRHSPDCEVIFETKLPSLPEESKARLRQMVCFLRELPDENFNFGSIIEKRVNHCASVACAIGWGPRIFPNELEWCDDGVRVINDREEEFHTSVRAVAHSLRMPLSTVDYLLSPGFQQEIHPSLSRLKSESSPSEVADMLEAYIVLTETPKL